MCTFVSENLTVTVKGLRKQIKAKPMLCKPSFIVHVRVKDLFKVILEYKNEAPQWKKWAWHMLNEIS